MRRIPIPAVIATRAATLVFLARTGGTARLGPMLTSRERACAKGP
ncbi:hypothetical protein ACFVTC_35145 [Streptomyces sp. NPDC057950]